MKPEKTKNPETKMDKPLKKTWRDHLSYRLLFGILIGGFLGYMYHYMTSCCADADAISFNPWFTTTYGVVLVGLLSK